MNLQHKNPWENNSSNQNLLAGSPNIKKNKSLVDFDAKRILAIWPILLVSGFVFFLAAKVYTRYMVVSQTLTTKVNIQQKEEITLQQAVVGTSRDPFNDKIAYFKSPALAVTIVDDLNLSYSCFLKGQFRDKSLYDILSWKVLNADALFEADNDFNFTIEPYQGKLYLKEGKTKKFEVAFDKPFKVGQYDVVLSNTKPFKFNSPIVCRHYNHWTLAHSISSSLVIKATKESNIIDITYTDISIERAEDILNKLVDIYNSTLRDDKSKAYSQAIDFINQRLQPLARELDSIENDLSNYQSVRGFVSENSNGLVFITELQEIEKKIIDYKIQKNNIDTIEHVLLNNKSKEVNVNFVGVSDIALQNNLGLYFKLRADRDKLALVATSNFYELKQLEKSINDLVKSIKEQIVSYRKTIDAGLQMYENKFNQVANSIKITPKDEKGLVDIKRMRNIKEALFLALIQKREESSIAKASTTVDTKLLSPPTLVQSQNKPSKSLILILATFLGILVPVLVAIAYELLNNKIISKKQLENFLSIPVIGELEFIDTPKKSTQYLFSINDRSMFGEQLRSIRTQLSFYKKEDAPLSIMITSNISGEGKSFLSINLAKSFALQQKKVALLEFDLRKPKIGSHIGISKSNNGLSYFLTNLKKVEDIVQIPFEDDHYFHFYSSGIIPPNPSELLLDEKLNELRDYLIRNYDVIIIDTPPFGLVSDAQIIAKMADVTLVVTRFNYTIKEQIEDIDKWSDNKIFPSMAVVFNGIKRKGYYANKYSYYYYKRRYGYEYYM